MGFLSSQVSSYCGKIAVVVVLIVLQMYYHALFDVLLFLSRIILAILAAHLSKWIRPLSSILITSNTECFFFGQFAGNPSVKRDCQTCLIIPHRLQINSDNTATATTAALWSGTNKNRDVSTGPFAHPFARTAHSLTCSALLASLARSAALTRSLARSLRLLPRSWESETLMS